MLPVQAAARLRSSDPSAQGRRSKTATTGYCSWVDIRSGRQARGAPDKAVSVELVLPDPPQIPGVLAVKMPLERHLAFDRLVQFPRIPMPRIHRVCDESGRLGVTDAAH